MPSRHRLANRRAHEVIAIKHGGQRYKIGLGRELIDADRRGHRSFRQCPASACCSPPFISLCAHLRRVLLQKRRACDGILD